MNQNNVRNDEKLNKYKYLKSKSIVNIISEELSNEYFYELYYFYVLKTPVPNLSFRGIELKKSNSSVKAELLTIFNVNDNRIFSHPAKCSLSDCFKKLSLEDGVVNDFSFERIVVAKIHNNIFITIFKHIRNALAHGKFSVITVNNEQYITLQDDDRYNVTARIVLKLTTLLKMIEILKKYQK